MGGPRRIYLAADLIDQCFSKAASLSGRSSRTWRYSPPVLRKQLRRGLRERRISIGRVQGDQTVQDSGSSRRGASERNRRLDSMALSKRAFCWISQQAPA
jgi:hypothetical protein